MTIFMDSFQYTTAQISKKWNQIEGFGDTQQSIASSGGPYNERYLSLATFSSGSNAAAVIRRTLGTSSTFSIAFAFQRVLSIVEDRITYFCELYDDSTVQLRLGLSVGEKLGIYRGSTLIAEIDHQINRNNWYHIRWKATISNSAAESSNQVRLVGPNVDLTATVPTATSTRVTTNNFASDITLCSRLSASAALVNQRFGYIANFFASNEDATLLPNLRVHPLRPTANSSSVMQWTPNTGTAWEAVDDLTPDDNTTKISTDVDGHIALFEHAGLPTPAESVKAVQMAAWSKKDDAFDVALEPTYRIGGTNYFVGESPVGNAYAAILATTDIDPAADPPDVWTEAVVNAMEIGVRVKQG